ncbi:HGxxPAAW family protein [Spongiactinospora sp. TRM90649]|uniref:HGxxPAAW family protein n=1 Tax=Spongiactinospora sp. TRM90649 TaxID=3031114 RepID=UPI0023F906B5|nr:HGxxPAAW family protein [Spongiactinospora sp. TRM90649]MDF5751368.1 hypothetical protein [Spongiactinospora sp. TRM90649]
MAESIERRMAAAETGGGQVERVIPVAPPHGTASHGGRASSWLAVTVMLAGFTAAGVALCLGPNWFVFWVSVGVCALGGILALVFDIFSDVIVDSPRVIRAAEHHSPFERG